MSGHEPMLTPLLLPTSQHFSAPPRDHQSSEKKIGVLPRPAGGQDWILTQSGRMKGLQVNWKAGILHLQAGLPRPAGLGSKDLGCSGWPFRTCQWHCHKNTDREWGQSLPFTGGLSQFFF